jgi:hypothetical protein
MGRGDQESEGDMMDVFFGAAVVVLAGLTFYVLFVAIRSWWETRETPKTDMFTCDKHGVFPVKYLIEMPIDDGGKPIMQCPFCYEEAFKKADERLKAEEDKRGIR